MTSFYDVPLPLSDEDPPVDVDTIDVRILTVKQPWATALISGGKDVENRSWATNYRGWVLIHAGKSIDASVPARYGLGDAQAAMALPRGCVIGAVNITAVIRTWRSRWAEPGCWHWYHESESAIELADPVPWRGIQGLKRAPVELLRLLPASMIDRIR